MMERKRFFADIKHDLCLNIDNLAHMICAYKRYFSYKKVTWSVLR